MKLIHRLACGAAFFGAVLVVGCSKPTGDLTGTVQYKGKSVVTGTVTAFDADKKPYQGAIEQGQYTIKGIPVGSVSLIVVSLNPAAGQPGPPAGGPGPAGTPGAPGGGGDRGGGRGAPRGSQQEPIPGWFAIPSKYEKVETSDLKTEIKAGPNTFNIELKD